ncbi:hypothetical protein DPMN_114620 [Dreissena polymorpha]|uniref:Integrase core domain-containing protein n=1 Tax=Dreissena polymorpha TaxID=45954 RepID=A0A9D4KJT4_DREPO|nr:hypothetical protein DPMN_114620 [Dreissena polymorpha]
MRCLNADVCSIYAANYIRESSYNSRRKAMISWLSSLNIPRVRLRDILQTHNKHGIKERTTRLLHRRIYHVQGPNHIWHIDTNHKLIRRYSIISAGVDGFIRMIMFMNAVDNNKSDTLGIFLRKVRLGLVRNNV